MSGPVATAAYRQPHRLPLPTYLQQQRQEQQDTVAMVKDFMERTIRNPRALARLVVENGALDGLYDAWLQALDEMAAEHKRLCRFG